MSFADKGKVIQNFSANSENHETQDEAPPKPWHNYFKLDEEESELIQVLPTISENGECQDEVPQKTWYTNIKRYFIFLLVLLQMSGLHDMAILSDIMQGLGLYMNCHVKYFTLSLSIIVSSYLITIIYVRFSFECSWCQSIFFPLQFE